MIQGRAAGYLGGVMPGDGRAEACKGTGKAKVIQARARDVVDEG